MLTIDGSFGEGGGQIVRSSLALSLLTGTPVTIDNLRAGRKKPGLARQHLTAVNAAREVGGAAVEGASLGSSRLTFHPTRIRAGNYHFNVGSAGSATLVLQTVLPALLAADGPSQLLLEGGTHNPMAPPFDFLAKAYLPLVNRMGPKVEAVLERPGFYPAGGGRIAVRIAPAAQWRRLELHDRGRITGRRVRAVVANLPRHIAERECRAIQEASGWERERFVVEETDKPLGPGNVVLIEVESAEVTEVFAGFGERGVRAEQVAIAAWKEAEQYLASDVPVGTHLADQLVLPMGIGAHFGSGGGVFRTLPLTLHAITHLEILRRFLAITPRVETLADGTARVEIGEVKQAAT